MRNATKILASIVLPLVFAAIAAAQQAPTSQPPRDGFPTGPTAQILSFTANPSSIQPGQSTTLEWAVVNADRITLNQGIGIVETRGSRTVSPAVTTTYTLAALGYRGTGNDTRSVTVTVAGTTAAPAAKSESESNRPIPRLPDGTVDLSGIYIAPFMSIVPIDAVTLRPGAEKFDVGTDYGFDLTTRCLPPGVPGTTEWPYPLQIVEKPGLLLILYEAEHLFRVIPTDGRPHAKDLDPTWMGDSVGHWEGDTLVVDVTGFNDKGAVREYRHTADYHVIERYRRTAYDTLQYEATIDDPNVFAAPWTEAGTFTLHPEWQIQEYICEENNHNYQELFEKYK